MSKAFCIAGWMKHGGLLLMASSIIFAGCQGFLLNYKGQKVRDAYWIALPDGTQRSASYQSADLIIDYHTLRNGDELQLSGSVVYTPKIRHGYVLIPYFNLNVFLIDQNGIILHDKGITVPGSDDSNNQMRFNEKIQLPPGTAYMAFSYSIEALSDGRDGGGTSPFWEIPIVR